MGNLIVTMFYFVLDMVILFLRFNENFDGVVLAYDEQFQSNKAKITPGIVPNLGVKLKAKLLLFSPKPDMLLGNSGHCLAFHFYILCGGY